MHHAGHALIALIGLLLLLAHGSCLSVRAEEGISPRMYAGRSLDEWQALLKDLDPQGPSVADLVSGLIELATAREVPWQTRRHAALTLGRIGKPAAAAVPVLIGLLDADEVDREQTRFWSAKALALMGPVASEAADRLARISADPREPLLLRMMSLEALGRIGADAPPVLPAFIQALDPASPNAGGLSTLEHRQLRIAAAEGLGLLGPAAAPALPQLIGAAQDRSPLLRVAAATTIGTLGPTAEVSIPTLVDLVLFDDAPEVADAAARSLGDLGVAALPALAQLLGDQEQQARLRAVWGLGRVGTSASPMLEKALTDRSDLVRAWAADSLLSSGADKPEVPLQRLIVLLESNDREARIKAYRTLRKHAMLLAPFNQQLQQLAESPRGDVRRAAQALLNPHNLTNP